MTEEDLDKAEARLRDAQPGSSGLARRAILVRGILVMRSRLGAAAKSAERRMTEDERTGCVVIRPQSVRREVMRVGCAGRGDLSPSQTLSANVSATCTDATPPPRTYIDAGNGTVDGALPETLVAAQIPREDGPCVAKRPGLTRIRVFERFLLAQLQRWTGRGRQETPRLMAVVRTPGEHAKLASGADCRAVRSANTTR